MSRRSTLDSFVRENRAAVRSLATRYLRAVPKNEWEDLHQEGLLGLCEGFSEGRDLKSCLRRANARMFMVAYHAKTRARRESLTVDAPRREQDEP